MKGVFSGRYTAEMADPVILFAIGMRVNRLLAVHRWLLPTFNTLRLWIHLKTSPPEGYLYGYLYLYWRGIGMMQYWKNFDSLEAFAHDMNQPHLKSWRQLAVQTESDRTFGYWHETYEIEPDKTEAIYGSMPVFGLAAASNHVELKAKENSARGRLKK
jgi:hypothetical protein